jgi:hypothetical protein
MKWEHCEGGEEHREAETPRTGISLGYSDFKDPTDLELLAVSELN